MAELFIQPSKYTFFLLEIWASSKNEPRFSMVFLPKAETQLELDKHLVFFYRLLEWDFHLFYHSIPWGLDAIFHFHGF